MAQLCLQLDTAYQEQSSQQDQLHNHPRHNNIPSLPTAVTSSRQQNRAPGKQQTCIACWLKALLASCSNASPALMPRLPRPPSAARKARRAPGSGVSACSGAHQAARSGRGSSILSRTNASMAWYSGSPSLSKSAAVSLLRASALCQNSLSSGPGNSGRSFWDWCL